MGALGAHRGVLEDDIGWGAYRLPDHVLLVASFARTMVAGCDGELESNRQHHLLLRMEAFVPDVKEEELTLLQRPLLSVYFH